MKTLTTIDLNFVLSRLPKDLIGLVKKHNLIIAGGFIRETISKGIVSDIDLFGKSKEVLELAALNLSASRKGRKIETDNAFTVLSPPRKPVQFIIRWLFDDPEKCCNSFDFTVCQAAIWFEKEDFEIGEWKSVVSENFYHDLAAKRLVYTCPDRVEDAGGSMLRVIKFIKRGYDISPESLSVVISRLISKIDFTRDIDEKEVGFIIAGLLREVDPLNIVDGIELSVDHEKRTKQE